MLYWVRKTSMVYQYEIRKFLDQWMCFLNAMLLYLRPILASFTSYMATNIFKMLVVKFLIVFILLFSLPIFVRYCITLKVRFCMMYPCSQCLCDIMVDNSTIQKLLLNSTDLGDEVSLLLTLKTVPWWHMEGSIFCINMP